MAQYYYTDGKERYGPFTIEQLQERNITPETLVWKEGMADWLPARQIDELQSLLTPGAGPLMPEPPLITPGTGGSTQPKNWLVESILVTLLCCLPFGIIGIIHSTKVEAQWNAGQRAEALKSSQEAGKWVKIGFFIGLTAWTLYFLLMTLGLVAGLGFGSGFPE